MQERISVSRIKNSPSGGDTLLRASQRWEQFSDNHAWSLTSSRARVKSGNNQDLDKTRGKRVKLRFWWKGKRSLDGGDVGLIYHGAPAHVAP
jgi:hypothetical protein